MESLAYSQLAFAYEADEELPVLQFKMPNRLMLLSGLMVLSILSLAGEAIAILKLGDRGPEVKTVQTRLQELGYFNANATGYFGPITQGAVIRFQKAQNLQPDGRVGAQTQAALQNRTAPNTAPTGIWRRGSQGEAVRLIQEQLGIAGFYNYAADGVFDSETENAVKAFQQANNLTVDGVVGPNTQEVLPALGGQQPNPNEIAQNPESEVIYLEQGSRGPRVRSLQQQLRNLGYYQGDMNGVFDADTKEAVMRFQQAENLTVDGVVGPRTFAQLGNARPADRASSPSTTNEPTVTYLGLGSQGTSVRSLQQRLRNLGYYQGDITGQFGDTTEAAVRRFQQAQGLTVDGVVGPRTFTRLGQAQPATTATTPPATPAPNPAPTTTAANPSNGTALPSEEVRSLQQRLSDRGFYDGDVDGIWGPRTQAALENAQRVYNVEAEDLLKGEF
ncbi:MAG: peptidoglycan-binding domain-containing protein [Spirulinaceae cyanobacterium]